MRLGNDHCLAQVLSKEEAKSLKADASELITSPCYIYCSAGLQQVMSTANKNLKTPGSKTFSDKKLNLATENGFWKAIRVMEKMMFELHHRMHKGSVYEKVDNG